jgi:uncharacterized protein (UPF0179 family)
MVDLFVRSETKHEEDECCLFPVCLFVEEGQRYHIHHTIVGFILYGVWYTGSVENVVRTYL